MPSAAGTMRYRDLPAVHLTPKAYARLAIPEAARVSDISISPGGEVIWSASLPQRTSLMFTEDGTPVKGRYSCVRG